MPSVADPDAAEELISAVESFTEDATGWSIRPGRASSVEYWEDGQLIRATVGNQFRDEIVQCILNTERLLVICTENCGIGWGAPIVVDKMAVATVRWFNGHSPQAIAA